MIHVFNFHSRIGFHDRFSFQTSHGPNCLENQVTMLPWIIKCVYKQIGMGNLGKIMLVAMRQRKMALESELGKV